jgi:hypothetical protein
LSRDLLSLLLSLLLLLLLHACQHLQLVEQHTRNSNSAVLHARKPPRSTTGCLTKTLQPYKQTLSFFLYNKMLQQHLPYQTLLLLLLWQTKLHSNGIAPALSSG